MLAKITAALVAYGPIGILLLAFIDSAGIPVATGMDALVILVAAKDPSRAYLAASLGVLGSLIGNLVLFLAARRGARRFIRDVPHPAPRGFRHWFERYGLLTVFIPAAIPIPLPTKIFVISAGVLRHSLPNFVVVILVGRALRYFGEAYLGMKLGQHSGAFLRAHSGWLIAGAVALFVVLYAVMRLMERNRQPPGID
jgi:membrane protein YqaA with SNARE-associated domain